MNFREDILGGIPAVLPQPKPYDTTVSHAPKRKDILSEEEKAARAAALEAATLYATEVPLKTMKAALEVFPIVKAMAAEGNPASVSDAGVGALAARSAVLGAQLNVRINAAGLADREAADRLCAEAAEIAAAAIAAEAEVLTIVNDKI